MAIGTTFRARATSGRPMKRRTQVGIPMVAEAGFRLPLRLRLGFVRAVGLYAVCFGHVELLRRIRLGLGARFRRSLVGRRGLGLQYRECAVPLSSTESSAEWTDQTWRRHAYSGRGKVRTQPGDCREPHARYGRRVHR